MKKFKITYNPPVVQADQQEKSNWVETRPWHMDMIANEQGMNKAEVSQEITPEIGTTFKCTCGGDDFTEHVIRDIFICDSCGAKYPRNVVYQKGYYK